jgi:uncharacterized membrane protein YhaH (DUF805 family)
MTHDPYTPPAARVSDASVASALPAYEPGSLGFFFSTRGRLNRKHYWINGLLSVLLLPVLFALVGVLAHMLWLVALSKVVVAWSSIVLVARRTHDFGCSGWWAGIYAVCLLFAAPFLKRYGVAELPAFFAPFLVLLVFGVIAGDRAANRFGMPQGDGPQMPQAA